MALKPKRYVPDSGLPQLLWCIPEYKVTSLGLISSEVHFIIYIKCDVKLRNHMSTVLPGLDIYRIISDQDVIEGNETSMPK